MAFARAFSAWLQWGDHHFEQFVRPIGSTERTSAPRFSALDAFAALLIFPPTPQAGSIPFSED